MRQAVLALVTLTGISLLAGCNSDPYAKYKLGPAREVVTASIDAVGGLSNWEQVDKVYATAVVAFYQPSGQADIDRLAITMDLRAGTITAEGMSPEGSWMATVTRKGDCTLQGARSKDSVCQELMMVLHRSAGPLNMVLGNERPTSAGPAKIEGVPVVRVGVQGGKDQTKAYYFDATTNLLRFVTNGADRPGGDGNITVYTPKESYIMLPDGLVFPRSFRVIKIGSNVLKSDTPVLDVDLTDIRVEQSRGVRWPVR
jgi:hypothetical protein